MCISRGTDKYCGAKWFHKRLFVVLRRPEELMRDWGSFAAVEKRGWRCLLREIGPQMGLGCEWSRVLEGALAALLYSVLASGLSLHMRC